MSESLPSSALAEIAEIARSKKASLHVIPSARWEEPTDEMDNIQALFIHGASHEIWRKHPETHAII